MPRQIQMLDGRIVTDTTRTQAGPQPAASQPAQPIPAVLALTGSNPPGRSTGHEHRGHCRAAQAPPVRPGPARQRGPAHPKAAGHPVGPWISIGVAAIVAVLGLSSSSQAGLLAEISALGTNLLTVTNGQTLTGGTAELPTAAPAMINRIPAVTQVQDTGATSASVYRSPLIPTADTNALSVDAASLGLPAAVGTTIARGSYLNAATAREPVAVLGAAAAQRLGIDRIWPGEQIGSAA